MTIEITIEEYNMLKECQKKLYALHAGGVDNWEYYSDVLNDASFFDEDEY